MTDASSTALRRHIASGRLMVVPGAANALTARLCVEAGFDAVYVTGAGIANTYLGTPDIGLVTLSEITSHVAAIRDAVAVPLIVDADTGFGNAIGVRRAVRDLERAGANAVQLEDQVFPKRCGHFTGKELESTAEMVQKIRAAVDARRDDDLVVIARTDARAGEGFAAALDRAAAYREAGADVTFVEAPQTIEEIRAIPEKVGGPQLINFVEGGRTPMVPLDQLEGYALALFANAALQGAIRGSLTVLEGLRRTGSLEVVSGELAGWQERQRLVRKPEFDELERRFAVASADDR